MALTNVQNAFLKMQLANNPEFQAEYFPNITTQGPVGPLYNVDIRRDGPANVYYERSNYKPPLEMIKAPQDTLKDPEYMKYRRIPLSSLKGSEFRDINVPYDTPGSWINIKAAPNTDFAYTRPGEMMYEDQPITGGQTSAVYMSPRIMKDYGTAPTSPRNQMTNTPDWYKELAGHYGIELPETMDQAHINDLIEGIISHEVSHGVSKKPEFKNITEKATTIDFKKMYPGISQEAIDAIVQAGGIDPYWTMGNTYHQEELYNRAKDLERLKMEHPNTWRTHPMLNLIIQRMKKHPGFKKLPRHPSKYSIYKKEIEPQVKDYFETVKDAGGGISDINIQKQAIGMPEHLTHGGAERQASLQAQVTAQANREAKQRVSRGKARDYGKTETRASSGWESSPFAKGGLIDIPLPGRSRYI